MKFKIKSLSRAGDELQRLALVEIDAALDVLQSRSVPLEKRTHEARKHGKRIRALLRLGREGLGREVAREENAVFRLAGQRFREVRDAQVLVITLEALRDRFFTDAPSPLLVHARRLLVAHERRMASALAKSSAPAEVATLLRTARERVLQWNLAGFRWKEARRGLKRAYRRAREAARAAIEEPEIEHLHEWRKCVKDLWYQVQLLRRASPDFMAELEHELDALAEFLGDDHDLATLRTALLNRRATLRRPSEFQALLKMLDQRRGEILRVACDVGTVFFEESPADFMQKLDGARAQRKASKRGARVAKKGRPPLK